MGEGQEFYAIQVTESAFGVSYESSLVFKVDASQEVQDVANAVVYECRYGTRHDSIQDIEDSFAEWCVEQDDSESISFVSPENGDERCQDALDQITEETFQMMIGSDMPHALRLHDSTPCKELVEKVAQAKANMFGE